MICWRWIRLFRARQGGDGWRVRQRENAVGMAAMVKADRLQMQVIARELSARLQTEVVGGGRPTWPSPGR